MQTHVKDMCLAILILLLSPKLTLPQIGVSSTNSGRNIKFEHISSKDGLSANSVNCILKGSKGFMWFGTQNGLNRYDGKRIKIYRHQPDYSTSLSNNHVEDIFEDKDGYLWIGTYGGGFNKFEKKTQKFTHYKHDPNNSNSLSNNLVLSLYEDKKDYLWIGTNGSGINKFNKYEESFVRYSNDPEDPNSLSHNIVRSFYEDKDGILWIGTDGGGLNKFDNKTEKFTCYKHDQKNPNSLSHDFVLSIIEDGDGALWLATYAGGLNKFNKDTETFSHFRHDPNDPNSLASDVVQALYKSATEPGVIWIATDDGIDKFEIRKEKFTHFKHDIYNSASLISNLTSTVYEDESGLVWMGTGRNGLSKYNKTHEKILHYKKEPTAAYSLSSNTILTIYEDKSGVLWLGTGGEGLNRFDRDKGVITHYRHQANNLNSLSSNKVYSIVEREPGILWIGTFDGLNKFDTKKNKFTIYKHDPQNPQSISHNLVLSCYIDPSGNIWIGTIGGGLNKLIFDEDKKTPLAFVHYKNDPNDPNSISENSVVAICEDDDGFLWVGANGLNKFDEREGRFFRYQHDPLNPNSLSNNAVNIIYQDKNGSLWIGTTGGGLNKLVPSGNEGSPPTFIHYREKDGLSNDNVMGILEDNHHNLWISTRNGLSRFNPKEIDEKGLALPSAFKSYYSNDGFQENEYRFQSYFKNGRGEMFFGGINGFNAFYPDSLKEDLSIPIVVLTDFQIFNESIDISSDDSPLRKHISETDEIVLSYKQNVFSFEFAVLHYAAPEKNKYAYKMEGFDKDWIYTDSKRRYVTYTHLDPGDYIFRVKGSNNDGVWNEEGASVRIIITPPFWETSWFYLLFAGFFMAVLLSIHRYRVRYKIKRALEIEHVRMFESEQVRKRAAADFHDELGHELTKISLFSEVVKKKLNVKSKEIVGYLDRISDASNSLLDDTRDFIWTLDPAKDSIYDVVFYLKDFGDELFDRTGIAFRVKGISKELENVKLSMEWKRHLTLIFKEAINNVLKHAQCQKATLEIVLDDSNLIITLLDDGVGFNSTNCSSGSGLKNMKDRAEKIQGEIKIISNAEKGTMLQFIGKAPQIGG
jgi:ligand-binding sensor domain-containing protein/signal transduction histidine kinase